MSAASAARVLQALKNTSIEGVSGRQRLDPQTGDRRWLLEVKNIVCLQGDDASSERQLSSGEGYCATAQTRTVFVQDETSGFLRPAAAVRWPAGFGDRLPDDRSLLDPSKCAVRLLSTHSLEPRAEFSFEIQIANSFGDAPVGTQRLVLVVASAVSVLSEEEIILVSPNQTVVTISRLAPSTVGAYNVSVQDTSAGYRQELYGSPFLLVVGAAPSCKVIINDLVSTRSPLYPHLVRSRETLIGSLVVSAMVNFLQSRFVDRRPRPRA